LLCIFNKISTSRIKKMFETGDLSYILPTHRLTVYIMGILTGIFLRRNPNGIHLNSVQSTNGGGGMI